MSVNTTWHPESYARNARFVSDLGEPLIAWLDPKPGEAILDLGCGDGVLTQKISAAGCAVLGVDASFQQARALKERGLGAAVMDGQQLALKRRFDAVFSNAALHWMKNPANVVAGVAASLKAGGRFVGEFGAAGNVAAIRRALHDQLALHGVDPVSVDPWYYPGPQEYGALMSRYGFAVVTIQVIPRPTRLPGDLLGWLEVFAQSFTNALPAPERQRFLAGVRRRLKPLLCDRAGVWTADYVRLRFKAFASG